MSLLQAPLPFSQSLLWELTAQRYLDLGPQVWADGLPHQGTANPWLARALADLILALGAQSSLPVTILDVGSGPGRFTFLLLQELEARWSKRWPPFHVRMLELSPDNLDFALEHPTLAPYVARGLLSGQVFDAYAPEMAAPPGPVVLIANYLLDSLKTDQVRLSEQGVQDRWVGLKWQDSQDIGDLNDLEQVYQDRPFSGTGQPAWDSWLAGLQEQGHRCTVHLPVGAVGLLEWARERCAFGLMSLLTDKSWEDPAIYQDNHLQGHAGTLSAMVDHAALDLWVESTAGQVLTPQHCDVQLSSRAHLHGLDAGPLLTQAWELGLGRENPLNAYSAQLAELGDEHGDLGTYLRLLRLSGHDPWAYERMHERVAKLVRQPTPAWQKHAWSKALQLVWSHHFQMEREPDIAFALGSIQLQLDKPRLALELFMQSGERYGVDPNLAFHLAACNAALGERDKARALAMGALRLDPSMERARALLASL